LVVEGQGKLVRRLLLYIYRGEDRWRLLGWMTRERLEKIWTRKAGFATD